MNKKVLCLILLSISYGYSMEPQGKIVPEKLAQAEEDLSALVNNLGDFKLDREKRIRNLNGISKNVAELNETTKNILKNESKIEDYLKEVRELKLLLLREKELNQSYQQNSEQQTSQLEELKKKLEIELEDANNLIKTGQAEGENFKQKIESLTKAMDQITSEINDYRKENSVMQVTIDQLTSKLNGYEQKILVLQNQLEKKKGKITKLKSKLEDMVDSKEKDLENATKKLMVINSQRMEAESKKSQEAEKTYEDRINFINANYEAEHKKAEELGAQLRELREKRENEIDKITQESLKAGEDDKKVKAAFIIAVIANAEKQKEIERLKLENSQSNAHLASVYTAWINSLNDAKAELQFFKDEVQSVYYQYNIPLSIVGATQSKTEKVAEKEEPSFFTNFFPTWWCDSNPATFTTGKCKLPPAPKKSGTNVSPKQKDPVEENIDYSQAPKSMGESFNQMIGRPYHDESQDPSGLGYGEFGRENKS